jgi:energy-coupling factor transporter transmembrane protein EcfT
VVTYVFPTRNFLIWLSIIAMFIILVFSYIKLNTKLLKLIIPPLTAILVLSFVANTVYMPSALKYHGPIQASYLFNRIASDSSKLYTYDYLQFETYFYPKNISEIVYGDQLKEILTKGQCWFITSESGYEEIKALQGNMIIEKYIFPYKKLTTISIRFLNPETRESELSKIYLLKIR